MPLYHPQGPEEYEPRKFLSSVLKELGRSGCPLCGESHAPRYHCFARRTFHRECSSEERQKVATLVPRIFCQTNHDIRKQTGEPKQYTLTILPSFLIPHSRIPVEAVHRAVDGYIQGALVCQIAAALRMHCLSVSSFRLFYRRVCERIEQWVMALTQLLLAVGGNLEEVGVKQPQEGKLRAQWQAFLQVSSQYVHLYAQLPHSPLVPERLLRPYIYAVLSRRSRGLGP